MFRKILICFTLPLLLFLSDSSGNSAPQTLPSAPQGLNPGPDIITGDMDELEQYGSAGTQVGLGIGTTSCNAGNVELIFVELPSTEHPIISHNLFRMSGGAANNDRFEQIGQSWVKHAFAAEPGNVCGFGCIDPGTSTRLGVGCSDTYLSFQNAFQGDLGSRALINPFTGVFQSTANNHAGHTHTGTSHRILVEGNDLNTTLNVGATYYAEVQYIPPDEYAWCQTHPGECNMYNNASYRRYTVSGTVDFFFSAAENTLRMTPAVNAWPGATIQTIEPAPGVDGRAFIACKVTGPVAGIWHYEYAIYNQNLDRAIQSFSVPLGCAVTLSNLGFHAPLNHPGFPNDGTLGDLGFSNAPWTSSQTTDAVSWSSETVILNQNANAIRWGTLYNFRFDSNKAPIATNATIGFFKTGAPVTVGILAPNACDQIPTPTPSPTPGLTPTPTPTLTPPPSPTPTPTSAAQARNLSTRMLVQTGDNVGIGGFIIAGSLPLTKYVLVRAYGPWTVPDALVDPVLELHGPPGFVTIINDNCAGAPIPPPPPFCQPGSFDAAIGAFLAPGAYTAVVRGKNNTVGVALVEVNDVDQEVTPKLANISTRAFVGTVDNILIAGLSLGGNSGHDRVLLRGIGPSLVTYGIANPLADPTLELRDNNGALLLANNNWQENPITPVLPPGLQPTHPLESVILATLPPGLYTALLAGVNSGTGVGLVEVYDLGAP